MFFYICLLLYLLSAYFFAAYIIKRRRKFFSYFKQWLFVASLSGTFFLLIRYRETSYLPLVSLFEITFFYAWIMSIFYLIFVKKNMARFIQGLALFIIYAILIWDFFLDKSIGPLNPLLDSFWLGIHVPTAILSYSAFALSFTISLYYIYAERGGRPLSHLDALSQGLIMAGVILLGVCIVTGAIWAKSAWGRFWSWDPKETWALITFMIYGCVVLIRKVLNWSLRRQAFLSMFGFIAVLFTFFGVSLIFNSHHAYR